MEIATVVHDGPTLDPGDLPRKDRQTLRQYTVYSLYEGGSLTGSHYKNTHMSVISFDLPWLTNGQDQLAPNDKPLNRLMTEIQPK